MFNIALRCHIDFFGTKEDILYLIIYTDDLWRNTTVAQCCSIHATHRQYTASIPMYAFRFRTLRRINIVQKCRELTFSYLWKISSKTIVNNSYYCRFYCVMGQSKVFSCYNTLDLPVRQDKKNRNFMYRPKPRYKTMGDIHTSVFRYTCNVGSVNMF